MLDQYDIDSLRDYEAKGLITGRDHPTLPLVVWNYTAETQYGRLWDATTLATRGLVTDLQGRTVAQCIPKFFNLAETDLSITDFDVAYEKLDGSLIHVFLYDGQWVCSSRGSFESDQAKWAQELVDENEKELNLNRLTVDGNFTFVCELIHPENRIVVDYEDEKSLRLISVFIHSDEYDWEETRADEWYWPWDKVQGIPMEALPTYLDQSGIEGVVLVGPNGRVKIKTDEYVEHHRIVTGLTTKSVLEYYMEHGNVDALLEIAPDEWYERIGALTWAYESAVRLVETMVRAQYRNVLESLGPNFERKDFAMIVKGQQNAPFLFALYDDKDIYRMVQRKVFEDRERYKDLEL